ncbi:YbbR-like domain-containing protein [uncultured Rummeliibacillus sp.]|uniref:CdaR family protein n=1 Tax=uncultured Rummeliibacillus sp. TaxID=762292 RepID=UPI002611B7D8|nr:CdaR family protein [uncultured Rummeliibacillus sp.]
MDKLIDSPWFVRITALALTLLIFFTVKSETSTENNTTTTSDRQSEIIHDVPVKVLYDNENLIVSGVPQTVDVSIEGPYALVFQKKTIKDYQVYLDLSKATIGKHKVKFKYKGFSNKLKVRVEPATVNVSIEEKVTRTFKVEPDFNESQLASNYFVKSMYANPNEVTVTGAKSAVDRIVYIKAMLSGQFSATESFTKEAEVKVLDRDMNKLDVIVEPATVPVKVDIGEYNKEVPISLNVKGSPKSGSKVKSLNTDTNYITLFGSKKDLEKITTFPVAVDVTKLKKSGDVIVNLPKPTGVTKLSVNQLKVHVSLDESITTDQQKGENTIEQDETSNTSIKTLENVKVQIRNLDTKQYTIDENADHYVSVVITGDQQKLSNVKKSDIQLYVDADNVTEGVNTLKIVGSSPSGTTWKATPSTIKLKVKQLS